MVCRYPVVGDARRTRVFDRSRQRRGFGFSVDQSGRRTSTTPVGKVTFVCTTRRPQIDFTSVLTRFPSETQILSTNLLNPLKICHAPFSGIKFTFPCAMPSKNCHREETRRLRNTDSRLEVMINERRREAPSYAIRFLTVYPTNYLQVIMFFAMSTLRNTIKIEYLKNWNKSLSLRVLTCCIVRQTRISTISPTTGIPVSRTVCKKRTILTYRRLCFYYVIRFSSDTCASIARLKKKNLSTKVLLLVDAISSESISSSRRDFIISVSDVLKTCGFDGLVLSDVTPTTYSKNVFSH